MSSVNNVTIIGNLGNDVEIRSFNNGGRVANLSVATTESYKKDGEWVNLTEWHRVSVTNEHLVKFCEKYLKKGSKVYLEGQLKTRKYTDKDGVEKYTTEIVLKPYKGEIVLLDKKEQNEYNQDTGVVEDSQEMNDSIPF